ncbi:hypothetical protein HDU98_011020 [Podochytrium sp. JEL0797]|nr:hypothetical protein HDU98_011020 [Podochytrium sp. JEL0797]
MIDLITTIKTLSPKTTIAIVPECYLYDQEAEGHNLGYYLYTGLVIAHFNATYSATAASNMLDYIIIQYYNNNICSYPYGFNFASWKTMFKGPIVVGLAGDWTSAISGGFLELPNLQAVGDEVLPDNQFGGFSVYDVSSSSAPYSSYSTSLSSVLNGTVVAKANAPQGPPKNETQFPWRCVVLVMPNVTAVVVGAVVTKEVAEGVVPEEVEVDDVFVLELVDVEMDEDVVVELAAVAEVGPVVVAGVMDVEEVAEDVVLEEAEEDNVFVVEPVEVEMDEDVAVELAVVELAVAMDAEEVAEAIVLEETEKDNVFVVEPMKLEMDEDVAAQVDREQQKDSLWFQ